MLWQHFASARAGAHFLQRTCQNYHKIRSFCLLFLFLLSRNLKILSDCVFALIVNEDVKLRFKWRRDDEKATNRRGTTILLSQEVGEIASDILLTTIPLRLVHCCLTGWVPAPFLPFSKLPTISATFFNINLMHDRDVSLSVSPAGTLPGEISALLFVRTTPGPPVPQC